VSFTLVVYELVLVCVQSEPSYIMEKVHFPSTDLAVNTICVIVGTGDIEKQVKSKPWQIDLSLALTAMKF